ncbi:MAG: acyl-CoA N-acyltransferase [Monoraphidium minutum]|nr:MAG: acyl-CoA N-acyltransferase [Monoraphidium minutum]
MARGAGGGEPSTSGRQKAPETFAVGTKVQCVAGFDNQPHPAEVLDTRREDGATLYYVHFMDCDKRLDEWVPVDRISSLPRGGLSRLESMPSLGLQADLGDQKVTRRLKRSIGELHHMPSGHLEGHHADAHATAAEKEHAERNRVKNIQVVEFGRHELDTWYFSPFPEPYASCPKLYICEYSLKYFRKKRSLLRHLAKLEARHPPGDEIYRSPPPPPRGQGGGGGGATAVTDPPIAVFEVDGREAKVYCQSLCLLSKLFLDHKTLYYDVDPFLFYVICEVDADGYHTVGYFSKEKNCQDHYNLACILTLPPFQKKGYGKFMISFAYQLSRLEGKPGTAERPLSDLGAVSFRSYWQRAVLDCLRDNQKGDISIQEISEATMMMPQDIMDTLKQLGLLQYWKGTHYINANPKLVEDYWRQVSTQKALEVDPRHLHWQPLQTAKPK